MTIRLVMLALVLAIAGCGGSQVRVLRTDATVAIEGEHWVVLPTRAPSGLHAPALEEALASALSEHWRGHTLTRGDAVERGFGVRVVVDRLARDPEAERSEVVARVAIVDPEGRAPDEIQTTLWGDGEADIGRQLAARVAAYVRDRAQHHH